MNCMNFKATGLPWTGCLVYEILNSPLTAIFVSPWLGIMDHGGFYVIKHCHHPPNLVVTDLRCQKATIHLIYDPSYPDLNTLLLDHLHQMLLFFPSLATHRQDANLIINHLPSPSWP